jgi:hypothetical protein
VVPHEHGVPAGGLGVGGDGSDDPGLGQLTEDREEDGELQLNLVT